MKQIKTMAAHLWRWSTHHKTWVISTAAALLLLLVVPTLAVYMGTADSRYSSSDEQSFQRIPAADVAIVFGAGVTKDGQPTPYLRWRVETGVKLYKAGKVHHLLLSGDNRTSHYNEPVVMGKLAQDLGVPASDITLDYAGYSTYDTCYRAKHIFGVDKAILVSQAYHVPRAIFTCSGAGIQSVGVSALHKGHDFTVVYLLRELLSIDKAFLLVIVHPSSAVGGQPEPIPMQS